MARIVVFFVFLAFLNFLSSQVSSPLSIKIGMMFPTNASTLMAYENTAGAATVALDRALKEKLFPEDTNFTIIWKYEECVEYTSAGYSFELINEENVDVLFAPPCTDGALLAGDVGTYYNIPVMLWGQTFDSRFADTSVYSTVLSAVSNYNDMASVICALMKFYEWDSFALIYQINEDGTCDSFQQDMESVSQNADSCVISYKEPLDSWAESDIQYTLNNIKSKARIVMLCFDDVVQERRFALKLSEANLNSTEYVYLLPNSDMKLGLSTKTTPWWIDTGSVTDGKDADAQSIAMRSLVVGGKITVDTTSDLRDLFTNFSSEVMAHMKSWPFYCSDCDRGQGASPYSATLYDSMYMYTLALSKIINSSGFNSTAYRNGKLILQEDASIKFEGMSGTIEIGADGIRNSLYFLMTYDANGNLTQQVSVEVSDNGVNATALYDDASTTIWKSRQGIKPLSTPKCGFDGKSCPVDIFAEYKGYIIGGVIGAILIIALSAYGIFYIFSLRTKDIERQNKLWQISVQGLTPITGKNKMLESMRSLQSGPSTNSSKYTFDSVKSNKFFQVFVYRGERVAGIQHGAMARLDKAEMAELRNMQRIMDHENVNRFIGITIDGSEFISIWRYCSRGTLQDILGSRTFTLDGFFMYSLIRDLSDGLTFIHSSFLECHGYLKSTNCLVDDRWQIKISDYGLKELRTLEKQLPVESLWTAPEVLRGELEARNKAADVYSFAIICSEIVNMKPPWEPREFKGPEEIVYLVKKGGRLPARPPLEPASTDLSPALMHLIKDCWSENPNDRPKVETIKTLLKSMNTGKSANLMDHVFNMLESYAVSLEEEVEERTKELIEEKKKSDILLYRMLPKQVAEKLKLGQSVEPETFECVTVFFSDVVSFTTLAARCTPLQVVNLLNTLYTTFDSIIGEHDVYKVETIGDGYLCVSGLPHRNGNEHARNIADMSLALIKSLDNFSIPHLPGEHVAIRIGIHTGGCVAGVVGLAMPRFCLFGDTINTASRMESNGKPNKIQLSFDANQFLTKVVGGYITQSRGEVIIKGKGVMETFWLVGKENDLQTQQAFYDREAAAAGQPKANKQRKEEDRISIESLKN